MKLSIIILEIFVVHFCSCNFFSQDLSGDKITVGEAYNYLLEHHNDSNLILLDVRTKEEYEKIHLKNSILIDFYQTSFSGEIKNLNKSKTYLVYCRTDRRSSSTLELMKEFGFKDVHVILGGMVEWERKGLRTEF